MSQNGGLDDPLGDEPAKTPPPSQSGIVRTIADPRKPPMKASRLTSIQTLTLWRDVTVAAVAGELPDLSARQLAVVLCVYMEEGPHTVRSLAARLNVTKAVISRAIDRLTSYGYVLRADDPRDKRSIVLRRTADGINFLRQFAGIIHDVMPDSFQDVQSGTNRNGHRPHPARRRGR